MIDLIKLIEAVAVMVGLCLGLFVLVYFGTRIWWSVPLMIMGAIILDVAIIYELLTE